MNEKTDVPNEQTNMVKGCLGLVLISTFCMVGAAALVYGAQWVLGW